MSKQDLIVLDTFKAEKALQQMELSLKEITGGALKAVKRALSKTATGLRTDVTRAVREEYNVPAKEIRKRTYIFKQLSGDDPLVRLTAQGNMSVPLVEYGARPRMPVSAGGRRPKQGVSVQVKKASGRKVVDGSFLQKTKSGEIQLYKRVSDSRKPIRKLFGPGHLQVLREDNKLKGLQAQAEDRLANNIIHEADFVLEQAGLK